VGESRVDRPVEQIIAYGAHAIYGSRAMFTATKTQAFDRPGWRASPKRIPTAVLFETEEVALARDAHEADYSVIELRRRHGATPLHRFSSLREITSSPTS